jgi:hypothetical protein
MMNHHSNTKPRSNDVTRQSQAPQAAPEVLGTSTAPSPARRRVLRWTAGGGAALIGAAIAKGAAPERVRAQAPMGIIGAWVITFPTGMDDPNAHQVVSFTSDGVMLASGAPSSPPDPQQPGGTRTYSTLGQGAWQTSAANQVRFKFVSVDTDEQGNFADLVQITGTLTLSDDGAGFTGSFQVQVSDAGGAVLFASEGDAGTVQGTRISV